MKQGSVISSKSPSEARGRSHAAETANAPRGRKLKHIRPRVVATEIPLWPEH